MPNENEPLQSERVMESVRDRVRAETLANEPFEVESLLLLTRDLRARREQLLDRLQKDALPPESIAELKLDVFLELDQADQNQEIPPAPEVERIAPLHFIHKVYRKIALKTQRQFNRAVVRLFRASLHNLVRVELNQLRILEELQQINRRLDELEKRLPVSNEPQEKSPAVD